MVPTKESPSEQDQKGDRRAGDSVHQGLKFLSLKSTKGAEIGNGPVEGRVAKRA